MVPVASPKVALAGPDRIPRDFLVRAVIMSVWRCWTRKQRRGAGAELACSL